MKQRILETYFHLLGYLARWYIKKRQPYVIGINGSVGKTSCRMIVHQTLNQLLPQLHIETSPKNFNGELGMSLSIFGITSYTPSIWGVLKTIWQCFYRRYIAQQKPYDVIILEYWIDHPGEMNFLLSIVRPHCSIHTQIDAVHSLQFGNPDNIAREEFLLQQYTRNIVFINKDDEYLHHVEDAITVDTISYSASGHKKDTTVRFDTINTTDTNIVQQATVLYNQKKSITLGINLLGDYHMAYASVWVCLSDILSYNFFKKDCVSDWQTITLNLALQPWRWTMFAWIHNSIIIDSTYNASPRSVAHIIHSTQDRKDQMHPTHKILYVLGDMRELGWEEKQAHEYIASILLKQNAAALLVWDSMKNILMPYLQSHWYGTLSHVQRFPNYEALWQYLQAYLLQNNSTPHIVVCKGSQNTIFLEEAIKYILVDKNDEQHLTRQWDRWASKKKKFLETQKR